MTHAVPAPLSGAVPTPIPVREIAPYAIFGGIVMLVLLYLVGIDQGVTTLVPGSMIHEFVHDGRHLLGFPCH